MQIVDDSNINEQAKRNAHFLICGLLIFARILLISKLDFPCREHIQQLRKINLAIYNNSKPQLLCLNIIVHYELQSNVIHVENSHLQLDIK